MATERTQYPFRQRKSRATTTLDLGDGPRAAPVVRGGNYHVAVQRAPESNLVKLADALSGLSTGAIKLYKSTQQQKEDEMKNLINTLTPEQARLALDGKTEELQESFEKMGVELDEAQRKNLISFSENPQNYIRSSRIAGERIASAYDVQIQQDMKKLVAENPDGDPSEILGSIRDEVIAENEDLFYEMRAAVLEKKLPKAVLDRMGQFEAAGDLADTEDEAELEEVEA